jgi:hypothetical protein
MDRAVEDLLGRAAFHHPPLVHHQDTVAQQPHHVQVVADEQLRHALLPPQPRQQLQHHRLHRHIQRAGRLIQHQQARLHRHGAGDAHPRLLPAGKLVRIAGEQLQRQPDLRGRLFHPRPQGRRTLARQQLRHRVGDGVEHAEARVQALGRVLKHHLDVPPLRQPGKAPGRDAVNRRAIQQHLAFIGLDQPADHAREGGLAAARFAHQPHRLTRMDHQVHIRHRLQPRYFPPPPEGAGARMDVALGQAAHFQHRGAARRAAAGAGATGSSSGASASMLSTEDGVLRSSFCV